MPSWFQQDFNMNLCLFCWHFCWTPLQFNFVLGSKTEMFYCKEQWCHNPPTRFWKVQGFVCQLCRHEEPIDVFYVRIHVSCSIMVSFESHESHDKARYGELVSISHLKVDKFNWKILILEHMKLGILIHIIWHVFANVSFALNFGLLNVYPLCR